MDLVDLQKLAKYNKGYKYLLTVIDVLSKFAWVEPLKSKSATAMVEALQRLWARLGDRLPEKVQTDSGGEFYNAKVQAFIEKTGSESFFDAWRPSWFSGRMMESNIENEHVSLFYGA